MIRKSIAVSEVFPRKRARTSLCQWVQDSESAGDGFGAYVDSRTFGRIGSLKCGMLLAPKRGMGQHSFPSRAAGFGRACKATVRGIKQSSR